MIAAVLLLSIQILAVVIYIYSFIPSLWNDPFLKGVEPRRDALFYAIFLGISVVLHGLGREMGFTQIGLTADLPQVQVLAGLGMPMVFFNRFLFFQMDHLPLSFLEYPCLMKIQGWLRPFFCVVCGLALISKIFLS